MQAQVQELSKRLIEEVQRWTHRLDALGRQVESSLRRIEETQTRGAAAANHVSWAQQALGYLDRRRIGGAPYECPMPELFAAIRNHDPELTVTGFHDGLRRLQDRRVVQLLPFTRPIAELPEPEYALPDGGMMCYYVAPG